MSSTIAQEQNLERQIEKQIGRMAGFPQLLTGKRYYTAERLPSMGANDTSPVPEKSVGSPAISRELEKAPPTRPVASPSPDYLNSYPATELPPKSPLPLPIFELKEGTRSSWKFCKVAPRLSLDSRATVEAKGTLYPREIRTNASILSANRCDNSEDETTVDGDNKQRRSTSVIARLMGLNLDPMEQSLRTSKPEAPRNTNRGAGASPWRSPQQRKSFFHSAYIFPEPKQTMSVYGEIERRLKMRGIDAPSNDLETLKQILEALQRKGLLHSNKPSHQIRSSASPVNGRVGTDSPSSNYLNKRKPLSIKTQRRVNDSAKQRRISPTHSPKITPKRIESDQTSTNRLARNKKSTVEIYAKEKISEMTATELQPSLVSVLDTSFYKEASFSPSPVMKRSIDFQGESEEEMWTAPESPVESNSKERSDDCDFVYIVNVNGDLLKTASAANEQSCSRTA